MIRKTRRTSNLRRRRASKKASRITSTGLRVRPVTKLRTVDEPAELLGVSKRTVQRLIDSGALRAHYVGRAVRISDADRRGISRRELQRLRSIAAVT
jgi:excisionase family DNA binding protein